MAGRGAPWASMSDLCACQPVPGVCSHTPSPARGWCCAELAKLLGNRTRALLAFEEAGFDPDAFLATYLGQLSEKAIDNARRDLGALLATCTEEVGVPLFWEGMRQQCLAECHTLQRLSHAHAHKAVAGGNLLNGRTCTWQLADALVSQ